MGREGAVEEVAGSTQHKNQALLLWAWWYLLRVAGPVQRAAAASHGAKWRNCSGKSLT